MKKQLFPWQEACLTAWENNHFRGIANVITGAGKTKLAMAAIKRLFIVENNNVKIKIVVPKNFLLYQWHLNLREELDIPREEIGFYSGTQKSKPDKKFMLYVINSARDVLARHIINDINNGDKVFFIADECHHYGSTANARIFTYIPYIKTQIYTLGLSATPWCANYNEVLVPSLGEEIYRFGFLSALNAGIINKFVLFNIHIPFTPNEREHYDEISTHLGFVIFKLTEIMPSLRVGKNSHTFFSTLEKTIKKGDPEVAELAKTVFILTIQRKEIVYRATHRIHAVTQLIHRLPRSAKIIIFSERIETATAIHQNLPDTLRNEVGVYHSQIPKPLAKHNLRRFESGDLRILITCKTLDEGLNITHADVGIVVSSTGSRRQRVQRLGRVLRKKSNDRRALFYYLYVADTMEEDELLQEMLNPAFDGWVNRVDLTFDKEAGLFENLQYEKWVAYVVEKMQNQTAEEQVEFMRNADRLILTEDWLMSEAACLAKINAADGKRERNYYIAALLIIRARMAK